MEKWINWLFFETFLLSLQYFTLKINNLNPHLNFLDLRTTLGQLINGFREPCGNILNRLLHFIRFDRSLSLFVQWLSQASQLGGEIFWGFCNGWYKLFVWLDTGYLEESGVEVGDGLLGLGLQGGEELDEIWELGWTLLRNSTRDLERKNIFLKNCKTTSQ